MTYEIEITRFAPEPLTQRITAASSDDAVKYIQTDDLIEFVVFVAAIDRKSKVDWGNFYIWRNPERALIELQEHCSHYATDPQLPPEVNRDVSFRKEDGSTFCVPYNQTVSQD